jgi:hypothetical protein
MNRRLEKRELFRRPRDARAERPPMAGEGLSLHELHRPARTVKRGAFPDSARRGISSFTASMAGAIAPATAPRCPLTSRGPKPPASARPALGGRFSPAGSGAGLCLSRTCRSTGHRPARAGETRVAFPDPARISGESTVTASLAGAIAPATAPRWDQDQPGAFGPDGARIACTYTGNGRDIAADAVVLVTSRVAADSLGMDLAARRADWAAAGIASVTVIGDADAPAPIAWAVYAGRRYGEELDGPQIGDALPFRREIAELLG